MRPLFLKAALGLSAFLNAFTLLALYREDTLVLLQQPIYVPAGSIELESIAGAAFLGASCVMLGSLYINTAKALLASGRVSRPDTG